MEKNVRLRVQFRQVVLPASTAPPLALAVNCWRVRFFSNAAIPPVIDGVNFEFFNTNSPVIRQNVALFMDAGGVYDRDGLPVYINQTFMVRSFGAATGLIVMEEYIDRDARQNR